MPGGDAPTEKDKAGEGRRGPGFFPAKQRKRLHGISAPEGPYACSQRCRGARLARPLETWAVLTLSEPLSRRHALPLLTCTRAWSKMFYQLRAIIRCKWQKPGCTGVEVGSRGPPPEPSFPLLSTPPALLRVLHSHALARFMSPSQ